MPQHPDAGSTDNIPYNCPKDPCVIRKQALETIIVGTRSSVAHDKKMELKIQKRASTFLVTPRKKGAGNNPREYSWDWAEQDLSRLNRHALG